MIRQLRRWLPNRYLVVVADSSYAGISRLADPQTVWETVTVSWYGGQQRTVEVATGTALWYHTGLPPVALRWVLIRDPQGKFVPQALLCTDQGVTATQIIQWFVLRGPRGGDLS